MELGAPLSGLDCKTSPCVSRPHFDQFSSPVWETCWSCEECLWVEGRDGEQEAYGRVHSHVMICLVARHLFRGKYSQAASGLPLAVVPTYTKPTQRRSVSHLLLLTFPLFTAHCRDTPFDSAAHTWPSASFCSAVLLLKIASACPGSTASLHKLWGGWGWRRGVRRGVKREESEEGVP